MEQTGLRKFSGLAFRGAESTAVAFDGKIWVLGGWYYNGTNLNTIRNNPDGKTWQTITPTDSIWGQMGSSGNCL